MGLQQQKVLNYLFEQVQIIKAAAFQDVPIGRVLCQQWVFSSQIFFAVVCCINTSVYMLQLSIAIGNLANQSAIQLTLRPKFLKIESIRDICFS